MHTPQFTWLWPSGLVFVTGRFRFSWGPLKTNGLQRSPALHIDKSSFPVKAKRELALKPYALQTVCFLKCLAQPPFLELGCPSEWWSLFWLCRWSGKPLLRSRQTAWRRAETIRYVRPKSLLFLLCISVLLTCLCPLCANGTLFELLGRPHSPFLFADWMLQSHQAFAAAKFHPSVCLRHVCLPPALHLHCE